MAQSENLIQRNETVRLGSWTITLLLLLNCKNVLIDQEVVPKSYGPPRTYRKGSPKPLFSYHYLKLPLSRSQERSVSSGDCSRLEARAHLVRGHFKLRKSGLYWWSPFVRGKSKLGLIHKEYEVVL